MELHSSGIVTYSDLPPGVDHKTFHRVYFPTIVQYLACQFNPWAIAPAQAIPIIQTAWDKIIPDVPYEITASSVVYRLVSVLYTAHKFRLIKSILETMQHVANTWHGPIGSSALMAIILFFRLHKDLYATDAERQEFTRWYLQHICFAWKHSDGDIPDISIVPFTSHLLTIHFSLQGMLRGSLMIQTFGTHLMAVNGTLKIDGIDDPDAPIGKPIGGLGLAAATIKWALTLIKDGVVTINAINYVNGKVPTLPKSVNATTSKESTAAVAFNDDMWGRQSQGFTKMVERVTQSTHQFENFEKVAKSHSKAHTRVWESIANSGMQDDDIDNEFAALTEQYNTDDDLD